MARKNALGRGLGALIDNSEEYGQGAPKPEAAINEIPVDKIEGNPWQPRSRFDEEKLNELAAPSRRLASFSRSHFVKPATNFS
ncbi:hypothetical protein [Marinilabilia salmonicolor]|uniref:hypothetical protein n=1 Tax=Marinilabilia salmonicolor TaxID=989 RepID=UPI001F1C6568|nr:hypothetical protein [Marinilabilia salmonicolor]